MKRDRLLDYAAILVFLVTAYWSWFLASLISEVLDEIVRGG